MEKEGAAVSQGLHAKTKRSKDAHRRFQFGLGEWTESSEDKKENDPPAPKKLKLTFEKAKERWQFLTEAENNFQQKYIPKNTSKATKWAHGNFNEWKLSRNSRFASEPDTQISFWRTP